MLLVLMQLLADALEYSIILVILVDVRQYVDLVLGLPGRDGLHGLVQHLNVSLGHHYLI